MSVLATIVAAQIEQSLTTRLDQIAVAQIVMAVAMVLITLVVLGIGVLAFLAMRSVNRVLRKLERSVEQLTPRVQPLLDSAARVAKDATDVTDSVRRSVHELMDTVHDVNRSMRRAADATEQRVRDFAAVLEVVQQEAEQILLDTTATARGLHATAESLRDLPAPTPARSYRRTRVADQDAAHEPEDDAV